MSKQTWKLVHVTPHRHYWQGVHNPHEFVFTKGPDAPTDEQVLCHDALEDAMAWGEPRAIETADDFINAVTPNLHRLAEPGSCSYRTTDGRGCIVACALTDEELAALPLSRNSASVGVLHDEELLPERLRGIVMHLALMQNHFDQSPDLDRDEYIAQLPEIAADIWASVANDGEG